MGVAELVEHGLAKQKVAGSIPSQGTCLGYCLVPQLGHIFEAADRCFPPSLSPSPFSKYKVVKKKAYNLGKIDNFLERHELSKLAQLEIISIVYIYSHK